MSMCDMEMEQTVARRDGEIVRLREEVKRLQLSLQEAQRSTANHIARLQQQLANTMENIERLKTKLDSQQDYEKIKEELRILKERKRASENLRSVSSLSASERTVFSIQEDILPQRPLDEDTTLSGESVVEIKTELETSAEPQSFPESVEQFCKLTHISCERLESSRRTTPSPCTQCLSPKYCMPYLSNKSGNDCTEVNLEVDNSGVENDMPGNVMFGSSLDGRTLGRGSLEGRALDGRTLDAGASNRSTLGVNVLEGKILEDTEIQMETSEITERVKELLQNHKIGQRVFGRYVLDRLQGSVSEILAHPKPWHKLTTRGKEPFLKMIHFLSDRRNVLALRMIQDKLRSELDPSSTVLGNGCSFVHSSDMGSDDVIRNILEQAKMELQAQNEGNEPRIQTRIKDQRRHNASGLDTGSEEIVKAILEKVRHEMQHQQDTGEHDRGSAGDNLISSAIQVKQEAEESGILDQRPLDHDLLSAASHTDFVQNIIQKVKSEIGAGDTFSNCTNSEIHPLTSSSSSTSGTTHSPSLSWKQDKMQSPPSREEMEFIGMRFGTEEDHADKIMIPDHLTFESYKENFQPPEGQGGQNYAGSLLVNNGLDTLSITRRVKEVLVENNLGQRLFGEQVLGLTQGSVSDLLSQPKPWSELSLKGREPFLRMYFWLKDPQNVERLVAMKRTGHRARSKRPFTFLSSGSESSSPEAFLDSITDHSGHCSMAKRSRVVLSSQEKDVLHRVFQQEPYPSQQTTQRLASQLGLQHSTVINWFYNHRSRLRRIIQEGRSVTTNYTSSPLPYTEPMSHFSDHHSYRGLDTSLLTVKQEPSEVELSEVRRETDIYLDTMYVSTAVQSSRNLKLEDEEEDINRRNLSREDGIQTATVMNDDPDGPRKLSANQKASLT